MPTLARAATGNILRTAQYFGQAGRWITYPDGRVFIPHGLDSFATRTPFYPAFFGRADARLLAEEGFTSLRVGIQPEAVEPQIGAYNPGYVLHYHALDSLLGGYGIGTYLALNQDGYTHRCGAGDGFPDWMVLPRAPTDALALSTNQCQAAWKEFFANVPASDGIGLRDHVLRMWTYVLNALRGDRNIIGFDLLNEPGAYQTYVPDSGLIVKPFMAQLLAAVRRADSHHLTFVEQNIMSDVAVPGLPNELVVFKRDALGVTGYTSHLYCPSSTSPQAIPACIAAERKYVADMVGPMKAQGFAYFIGEFGASDELTQQVAIVDAADQLFVPWNDYAYNSMYDASGPPAQRLLIDEAKPASEANAKQAKLNALVVPYPMAVAGTPSSWSFDRKTGRTRFTYSTRRVGGGSFAPGASTVIFVPRRQYPSGYAVAVSGARIISGKGSPWLELQARPGAGIVTLTVRRTAHGRTLTPLEVNRCGYDLGPCG